jgi:hypothetical protein
MADEVPPAAQEAAPPLPVSSSAPASKPAATGAPPSRHPPGRLRPFLGALLHLSPCLGTNTALLFPTAAPLDVGSLKTKVVTYVQTAVKQLGQDAKAVNAVTFTAVRAAVSPSLAFGRPTAPLALPTPSLTLATWRHCRSQRSASYQKLVVAYGDSLLGDSSPASKALVKAAPVLGQVAAAMSLVAPFLLAYAAALRDAYMAVVYLLPWHVLELLAGLVVCFFGGEFYALIACYEAYQLCGGAEAAAAARTVVEEAQEVATAAGAAGDNDAAPRAVVRRNLLLVAKSTHPEALTAAVSKLWMTWLCMLAAMQLKLARTLVLGSSISKALLPVATRHVLPRLEGSVPAELQAWNATLLRVALTAVVLVASSLLSSLVAAAQAALRGGQMAAKHGLEVLAARGTLKGPVDDKLVHTVGLLLAAAGVLAQAAVGFRLPFPLNLVLLPLTLAEMTLRVAVAL